LVRYSDQKGRHAISERVIIDVVMAMPRMFLLEKTSLMVLKYELDTAVLSSGHPVGACAPRVKVFTPLEMFIMMHSATESCSVI
jgi:hypothetical protein